MTENNVFETLALDLSEADLADIASGYDGPDLPSRTIVDGVLAGIYLTKSQHGDHMFKVLHKVTAPQWDGFPVWDNVTLTKSGAFKWWPLCELLGVTVEDLATSVVVDRDRETGAGYPVVSIGDYKIDGELEINFSVTYEKYEGTRQPKVQFRSRA